MNNVARTLSSADITNFSPKVSKFSFIKKYMYRLHFDTKFLILLTFLETVKIVLIKTVTSIMMSAEIATPGLLEKRFFERKIMTS